mmetsp:Transcript_26419/g.90312  ORF Transcript_26419/g.90312 Transcript_26419/m.90312 type:complete len:267 (+) Transcript_26419:393-1193(+)
MTPVETTSWLMSSRIFMSVLRYAGLYWLAGSFAFGCRNAGSPPGAAPPASATPPSNPNARLKSFGPALIGATKCAGTTLWKFQAQILSTHSVSSLGRFVSTRACRMGATMSGSLGLVTTFSDSGHCGAHVKPVKGLKLTASGWKKSAKSTVLPQPLTRPSLVFSTTSSLSSFARFSSGRASTSHTSGGVSGTLTTTSVTSSVLVALWKNAASTYGPSPRGVCSTAQSSSSPHGSSSSSLSVFARRGNSPRNASGRLRGKDHCPGTA